jgi:transcriptional regulator of acetoin/glycerol metabolism
LFELFDSMLDDRTWTTIHDLSPALLLSYRERFARQKRKSAVVLFRPEEEQVWQERRSRNELLIQVVRHEIGRWGGLIPVPHLFLLADEEGVAIHLDCPEEMGNPLRESGLREGVHFSLGHLGINGISMAIERQTVVVVRGQEHDVELFQALNCLCIPIRTNGKSVAYLDMSFSHQHNIEFAIPILLRIVERIERRLGVDVSEGSKTRLFGAFERFKLTPREMEAAYGWLRGSSALRIAEEMGITEGSVRNLIKKVYAKTKQRDKGQFIQAFIQWL